MSWHLSASVGLSTRSLRSEAPGNADEEDVKSTMTYLATTISSMTVPPANPVQTVLSFPITFVATLVSHQKNVEKWSIYSGEPGSGERKSRIIDGQIIQGGSQCLSKVGRPILQFTPKLIACSTINITLLKGDRFRCKHRITAMSQDELFIESAHTGVSIILGTLINFLLQR